MSEDLLIRHCSPTLAGIKTGNLFSCACPSRKDLTRDLCRLNKKLVPKGIRVLPLRVCKGRALIYAYRPNALESDLTDHRARALLLKYGYVPENPNGCVVHLIHRLRSEGEFPHEIGLFFELSAGGCAGLYLQSGVQSQVRGLLEGLRRRTGRQKHL